MIFETFENWIEKLNRFVRRILKLEPTEREWPEFDEENWRVECEYQAEQERLWQLQLAEERELLEKMEREQAEYEASEREYEALRRQWDEKDAERERIEAERERLDEEWMEEQDHYRSYCPFCGTRYTNGRCKPCDRAFGRD